MPRRSDPVFNVLTQTVTKGTLSNYIKLGGDVTTETNIDVYPEVQYGKIIQINVIIGDYVRKGDVVVVVDPSQPGSSFAPNPVIAPISGYVTALYAQLGAVVSGQVPVAKIGVLDNQKDIYVKTFVPEKYVSSVTTGTEAEIQFSYEKEPFRAKVSEITPVLDPMSRTFEVWLRFNQFNRNIRVGSYPDIKLFIETKHNVIAVPTEAVVKRSGNEVVFVYEEELRPDGEEADPAETAEEKETETAKMKTAKTKTPAEAKTQTQTEPQTPTATAKMVPVETGIRIDGKYEITKGLNGGEELIVKGNTLLMDGVRVKRVVSE